LRLGVLASGQLGHSVLKQLVSDYKFIFVMTDEGSIDIRKFCDEGGIECFVGNPRKGKCTDFIENKHIDVLMSVNYLFIIERDLIELPKKIAFNVHGSLLPKYRGRTPHVWAIINNEKVTGISAHVIDEDCDTGDILEQVKVVIEDYDTGASILNKFEDKYPTIIKTVLSNIQEQQVSRMPQEKYLATYFGKRTPEDGQIDWNWQRERIRNWVRAQAAPYPGAFSWYGNKKVIIDEVVFDEFGFKQKMENGLILTVDPLRVKTPNGVLKVTKTRLKNENSLYEGVIFK